MTNKSMLLLVFIWFSLAIGSNLLGRIEGEFFPVIENFEYYVTVSDSSIGGANIFGSFNKTRNCDFEKIRWYLVDESKHRVRIAINFNDEQIRIRGKHYFGPWSTFALPSQLETMSRVYIEHNCHPIWKTTTRVK